MRTASPEVLIHRISFPERMTNLCDVNHIFGKKSVTGTTIKQAVIDKHVVSMKIGVHRFRIKEVR